jgi:hypothetical protein
VTPEKTQRQQPTDDVHERTASLREITSLDVWARSAPIRLAGYEDDLAEPHILQGVD